MNGQNIQISLQVADLVCTYRARPRLFPIRMTSARQMTAPFEIRGRGVYEYVENGMIHAYVANKVGFNHLVKGERGMVGSI